MESVWYDRERKEVKRRPKRLGASCAEPFAERCVR